MRKLLALLGVLFILSPIGFGIRSCVRENEIIDSMSEDERSAYMSSLEDEENARVQAEKEAQEANQKADMEFKTQMQAYETDTIIMTDYRRGVYVDYELTDVSSSDITYAFGENLPVGSYAHLNNMRGRGGVGFSLDDSLYNWEKAGRYGIYHFEHRKIPRATPGASVKFEDLSKVDIRIFF